VCLSGQQPETWAGARQKRSSIGYHGDAYGGRKVVETGAQEPDLLLAHIEEDSFVISDNRSFSLPECTIKFTSLCLFYGAFGMSFYQLVTVWILKPEEPFILLSLWAT